MGFQPLKKKINLIFFAVTLAVFLIVALVSGVVEYQVARAEFSSIMQARINVVRALIKDALFHTDAIVASILKKSGPGQSKELFAQLADSATPNLIRIPFISLIPRAKFF